jgi:hypothetical protein
VKLESAILCSQEPDTDPYPEPDESPHSSVGRERRSNPYTVQNGRLRSRGWIPSGVRNYDLLHSIQTGSGAHPASYPMGTGGSLPGVKADHSPPTSAEVKKM